MHLGFGLYRHMLNDETFAFARQCGATHAVVHLVDYFQGARQDRDNQPVGSLAGWGMAGDVDDPIWTEAGMSELKQRLAKFGLTFYAIENFDPSHWHDVLLAGPRRDEQLERLANIIRAMGAVGIPVFGYNFSLAGVCGRVHTQARGGAASVGMDGPASDHDVPMPGGMVWNMVYAQDTDPSETHDCTPDELWERLDYFLRAMVPVAEQAGVRLAAHPDDPPLATLRRTPRLVYRPELYDKLLDLVPSRSNALEFCLGTLAEMPGHDVHETCRHFLERDAVAYIHLRNVVGQVPHYRETFIDEGEIDVPRIFQTLRDLDYQGVVIPDHTPQMACDAPWHAGMAYAMGYMRALLGRD